MSLATTHPVQECVVREFGDDVLAASDLGGQPALTVQAARPFEILRFLREREGFDVLVDLTALDTGDEEKEWDFELVYALRAPERGVSCFRLHVAVIGRKAPKIPTAVELWPAAAWLEREVAEMFGIVFRGHPDPRKLLLPDNFESHPLRREYPIAGEGERESFPTVRDAGDGKA